MHTRTHLVLYCWPKPTVVNILILFLAKMDEFSLVCWLSKFLIAPLRAHPCQGHKESGSRAKPILRKGQF